MAEKSKKYCLSMKNVRWDEGKKASIRLQLGDYWYNVIELIYLRKDLLKKYLKEKNKQLVWII